MSLNKCERIENKIQAKNLENYSENKYESKMNSANKYYN